mgnify:CR=1 FL=1
MLYVDMGKRRGRPPLPEQDKRTDLFCVRLNDPERRRLQRLSGVLGLVRLADVIREGLLALEEREANKMAELAPKPVQAPVRKIR